MTELSNSEIAAVRAGRTLPGHDLWFPPRPVCRPLEPVNETSDRDFDEIAYRLRGLQPGPRPTVPGPSWDEKFTSMPPKSLGGINAARAAALRRRRSSKPVGDLVPKARRRSTILHTYVVGAEGFDLVKIGHATNPKKRLASLQTGQPMQLTLLWSLLGDYEAYLHSVFAEHRVRGEWFDLTSLGDPVEAVQDALSRLNAQSQSDPR